MVIKILLVVLVAVTPSPAKEWRGLVPLHSTREDVERLLGPPSTASAGITFYEFEKERVSINYATGPCGVKSSGWNVPHDTVTSIWATPKRGLLKLADLKLDESKYKKVRDDHVWNIINYINEVEGISYQVDTSDDDMVTLIKYFPAAKDNHLRCPATGDDLEKTTKFDEYSDIPFESEKQHLNSFAEKMLRYASTQAYLMVYAGRRARAGEAQARAERAKEYLVKVRGINAKRVVAVNGGYQEKPTVELYLVPLGASPPRPEPTVEPNEVQIIKPSNARAHTRRPTRRGRKL